MPPQITYILRFLVDSLPQMYLLLAHKVKSETIRLSQQEHRVSMLCRKTQKDFGSILTEKQHQNQV